MNYINVYIISFLGKREDVVKVSFTTFGMELFCMLRMVVVVSTAVIPNAILAGITSFLMKKLIHESITIMAHGAYRCKKKYS